MIVADSSAWIEFLRGSDHPVAEALSDLLREDADLALTEIIVTELLAGATSDEHLRALRARLVAFPILRLEGLMDFEEAALIYRRCRSSGHTLRSMIDCLIAVPVLRAGARLLHNDSDFDAIVTCTALEPYLDQG
ncbi:MAG: type II toxin-antitoxin system VapC family toxin [Actinomycetota bacterium]